MSVKKLLFTSFIVSSFAATALSGQQSTALTYEQAFPRQYEQALELKDTYRPLFAAAGSLHTDISPDFYIAIVFPEMERFSARRDYFETVFTRITYGTVGQFEGCSIGTFQMKPDFAEKVEEQVQLYPLLKERYVDLYRNMQEDSPQVKYKRVVRLHNKAYQVMYIKAFVDLCMEKYSLESESTEDRLRFISTVYNVGLVYTRAADYKKYYTLRSFPEGSSSSDSKWNYSDLALHYYRLFAEK